MRRKSTLFIVLGVSLLLAAGGVAAMSLVPGGDSLLASAAQQEPTVEPSVPVVIAQLDLPQGTLIDAPEQFLSISEVPASQFNAETQFNDLEELRDMVTATGITAGNTLRKSDVREAGLAQKIPAAANGQPALKAFPIQVNSLSGVGDLVQPGDFVDVLASFNMDVVTLRPGVPERNEGTLQDVLTEQATTEGVSRVLLQDIEVVDVLKPALPTEGEEGADEAAAPSDAASDTGDVPVEGSSTAATTLNSGNWMLVLAVTNQEAEVLRFTLDRGIGITTVLRRTGDHATERTVGATMRILVDSYGLPMPTMSQVMQQTGPVQVPRVPTLPTVDAAKAVPPVEQR